MIIGQSVEKIDALSKVTGTAKYAGDLTMPGMLYAKTLFAERPHARILNIDLSDANSIPGVVAILTAKDVPVNEYGLQKPDQPVLCGPGSSKPGTDIVRFVGDQIAFIVAQSEEIAEKAMNAIHVEFEDLPIVSDPAAAMQPDAYSNTSRDRRIQCLRS